MCVYVYVCVCVCACVCVCVCAFMSVCIYLLHVYTFLRLSLSLYIYIYIYMDAPHGYHMNTYKTQKLGGNCKRMLRALKNKSWKHHPHKTAAVRPLASHLTHHPSKRNKTCEAPLKKRQTRKRRLLADVPTWVA